MKRLLMGSISLLIFSASLLIFQISCQKEIVAQSSGGNYILPPATNSTLGGVIVGNGLSITSNGTLSATGSSAQINKIIYRQDSYSRFWIANYDGSGATELIISLPAPYSVESPGYPVLSPDGSKLFVMGIDNSTAMPGHAVFSCNADGSNPTQIINLGEIGFNFSMVDAY